MRLAHGAEPAQALQAANSELGADALSNEEATHIFQWLAREGLLEAPNRDQPVLADKARGNLLARRLNLLFVRVPLLNPDRLLDRVLPLFHWMLGWPFFALWLLVCITGAYQMAANWDRAVQSSGGMLYTGNWLWLIAVWVSLKVTHELFHGLVSKKYGGHVYEAGVVLVLLLPIGYVDATASWGFRTRWQRLHTAVAGMYIELFIAGLAAWVWALGPPGIVNDLAFNCVVVASVSTLIFNCNPLMRFDGYFVLSDLVALPNLYSRGQAYVRYLFTRYLLGVPARFPDESSTKRLFIKAYGVAALTWRVTILIVLMFAAYNLFYGAGLIIVVSSFVVLVMIPAWRFIRYLISGTTTERPSVPRFAISLGLAIALGALIATQLNWSRNLLAPGVIAYTEPAVVRAETPGFVREVMVEAGEQVTRGTILAVLENRDVQSQLFVLGRSIQQSNIKARLAYNGQDISGYQLELENQQALIAQKQEKQRQVDALVLKAPRDGLVVAQDLAAVEGVYLSRGTELLSIVDEARKELILSVSQDDIGNANTLVGTPIAVRIPTGRHGRFDGVIERVVPRASVSLSHPSLTALNGGPLPVRPKQDVPDPQSTELDRYELLSPRFEAISAIDGAQALSLRVGATGSARFAAIERPIGAHLQTALEQWIQHLANRR